VVCEFMSVYSELAHQYHFVKLITGLCDLIARKRMLVCDVVLDSLSELTERWLITRSLKQLVISVHN